MGWKHVKGRVGVGYLAAWLMRRISRGHMAWDYEVKFHTLLPILQGCCFRIPWECAEGEVAAWQKEESCGKEYSCVLFIKKLSPEPKEFLSELLGHSAKRSAWIFLQSSPCQSKGNKSKALQMGVLPSCNVSNPQGFWMGASFFESWVLMCMISWWALGHLINSLHLVFSSAALFQELHAASPKVMPMLW